MSCSPSLARRFPFHFAPFGLTALTALRSVLLKNRRLVRKKNILFLFNMADMIPKNHILRLINKLGLSPEFLKAF